MFSSTEPTAIGAILAAKSRQLGGKLKFVAFDSSDALIEELRAGTIQATVVQDPFRMGYQAVRTVVDSIRGEKPPKKQDLPARVVRTADLEDPEVKELLFPDLSRYLAK
jgi:ribose transport system substrate-binding protein